MKVLERGEHENKELIIQRKTHIVEALSTEGMNMGYQHQAIRQTFGNMA